MADRLTVDNSNGASKADGAERAGERREAEAAAAKIADLKKRARVQLNQHLTDDRAAAILARHEAKQLAHKRTAESAQRFENTRGQESLGSKATDRQTQAAKTTGAEGVRGADGLSDKDRQSVRADPKAGPKLPSTDGKATTPEQAVAILSKIFGQVEVNGEKLDLAAYARTLEKKPPTGPKTAGTTGGTSAAQTSPSKRPLAKESSAGGMGAPQKSLTMNVRNAAPVDKSFNAGGGLLSTSSFDGMHFNWDGFFANFLIRAQKDLHEWRRLMKELMESQQQLTRTSIEVARELLAQNIRKANQRQIDEAREEVKKAAEPFKQMPALRAMGQGDAKRTQTANRELLAQYRSAMSSGGLPSSASTAHDKALRELRNSGGDAAVVAFYTQLASTPGLAYEQRAELEKRRDEARSELQRHVNEASFDDDSMRTLGSRRNQLAGEREQALKILVRPELLDPAKVASPEQRLALLQKLDNLPGIEAVKAKHESEIGDDDRALHRNLTQLRNAHEQLARAEANAKAEKPDPNIETPDKAAGRWQTWLRAHLVHEVSATPGPEGDQARQLLYGKVEATPEGRARLFEAERDIERLGLEVMSIDHALAKGDEPRQVDAKPSEAFTKYNTHRQVFQSAPKAEQVALMTPSDRYLEINNTVGTGNNLQSLRDPLRKVSDTVKIADRAKSTAKAFEAAHEVGLDVGGAINRSVQRAQATAKQHAAEADASMRSHYGRAQGLINQLAQLLAMGRSR